MNMKCERKVICLLHVFIFLLLLFLSPPLHAETHISGGQVFDQHWTPSEGPYIIEGIITIPVETFTDSNGNGQWDDAEEYTDTNNNGQWDAGEPLNDIDGDGIWDDREPLNDINGNNEYDGALSLQIAPGTELRFAADAALKIYGILLAEGTAEDPIRMLRNDGGGAWDGVQFITNTSSQSVLEHVEISGAETGVLASSSSPQISYCVIEGNSNEGIQFSNSRSLVEHCIIRENGRGIYLKSVSPVCIENNWIGANTGDGIYYDHDSANDSAELLIRNNIIAFNGSDGIDLNQYSHTFKTSILYNTITYNAACGILYHPNNSGFENYLEVTGNIVVSNGSYGVLSDDPSRVTISYNDIWGNANSYYGVTAPDTDIAADPQFIDDNNDFHLHSYSPCVDAGEPLRLDLDGSRADMGAYGGLGLPVIGDISITVSQNEVDQFASLIGSGSIDGAGNWHYISYVWSYILPDGSTATSEIMQVDLTDGKAFFPPFTLRTDMVGIWKVKVKILNPDEGLESNQKTYMVTAEGADSIPPGQITDLQAVPGTGAGSIILTWTAPGDDGRVGTAAGYEVCASDQPITEENFSSVDVVEQSWIPVSGNSGEYRVVSGLTPGGSYYFALRAVDEAGNAGAVSNSTMAEVSAGGSQLEETLESLSIKADSVVDEGNGIKTASGNVIINDILHYSGSLTIDSNAGTVSGDGELTLENVPGYGRLVLYNGAFTFNAVQMLAEALSSIQGSLVIGGMTVGLQNIKLIDNGVSLEGYLASGSERLLAHFKITLANGIELVGGDLTIGKARLALDEVTVTPVGISIGKALMSAQTIGEVAVENLVIDTEGLRFQNGMVKFMNFTALVDDLAVTEDSFSISGSMAVLNTELAIDSLEIGDHSLTFKKASSTICGLTVAIGSSQPDDGSNDMILSGLLTLPENMGGTSVAADFILHPGGSLDLRGRIKGINIGLEGGYQLENAWLEWCCANTFGNIEKEYAGRPA